MSKPSDKNSKGFLQNAYNFFAKTVYKCEDIGRQLTENTTDPEDDGMKPLPQNWPPVVRGAVAAAEIAFVLIPHMAFELAEGLVLDAAVEPAARALRDATQKIAKATKHPVTEYQPPRNGW
jgi:hypothetical protein